LQPFAQLRERERRYDGGNGLTRVDMVQRLLTIDEVAARFRVSRRTLQAHIRRHPYYRLLGRHNAQAIDGIR
jgi:hypothetical protein